MTILKQKLPIIITSVVGFFLLANFFLDITLINSVADEIKQWCVVIFAFAIVLGVANIVRNNFMAIVRKRPDWEYKIVLLAAMIITSVSGLWVFFSGGDIMGATLFHWIYDHIIESLSVSMYALLAFFIASAAFRAFKARNVAASLMLGAALLVMIGRVPLGAAISPAFPRIANWIMSFPNAAGQRGIIMGAAVGVVAVGLKIISGMERPYLR